MEWKSDYQRTMEGPGWLRGIKWGLMGIGFVVGTSLALNPEVNGLNLGGIALDVAMVWWLIKEFAQSNPGRLG